MRTRRSPRNQEILWRAFSGAIAKRAPARIKLVARTENGTQFLVCGHSVTLPPCWTGRYPRERHCPTCAEEVKQ